MVKVTTCTLDLCPLDLTPDPLNLKWDSRCQGGEGSSPVSWNLQDTALECQPRSDFSNWPSVNSPHAESLTSTLQGRLNVTHNSSSPFSSPSHSYSISLPAQHAHSVTADMDSPDSLSSSLSDDMLLCPQ
jgi:hypothetical protein